jgi:hypothetical protein
MLLRCLSLLIQEQQQQERCQQLPLGVVVMEVVVTARRPSGGRL